MSDLHRESRTKRLDRALHDLLAQTPEVEAASVVSFDGLPMAAALPPSMDEDRVAAMSAALLSLGERAAEGLGRGELSQVYIEGDNGTVFLVSCEDEAVLVAVASKGAKVGMMLYEVRHTAKAVADVLRQEVLEPVQEYVPEPMVSAVQAVRETAARMEEPPPPPHPEPAPVQEPAYAQAPAYAAEPAYAPEPAYNATPAYAQEPAYNATPAYAQEAPQAYEAAEIPEQPVAPAWSSSYAPLSNALPSEPPRWS
ncbi:MAG: Roadblock/LC7 family protein [Frankiales bacterium]|nr:Roadblock/LC7 family protein [Frankiales bacterium]